MKIQIEGPYASLEDVMAARDKRVSLQSHFIEQYHHPLISFSLNIMGPCKQFALSKQAYYEGKKLITQLLTYEGIPYTVCSEYLGKTGSECLISVEGLPQKIKNIMVEIEESCPIGRLFDIDVIQTDGTKVARSEVGYPERTCLICDNPAMVCGRNRSHSLDTLVSKTVEMLSEYFNRQYAESVAMAATQAMLYEVSITPKPGLVDRTNSGAHQDMDFFTFLDSSVVLHPWFCKFVMAGILSEDDLASTFQKIRVIGKQAEVAMNEVTNGVNTHKGLIFSIGIICSAAGYLYPRRKQIRLPELLETSASMAKASLPELTEMKKDKNLTNGELIYSKYGAKGIRQEAANGFPNAMKAFTVIEMGLESGHSINDSCVSALLNLMGSVEDTNIIKRSNLDRMLEIQEEFRQQLALHKSNSDMLAWTMDKDQEFIEQNISPGGCADLLAIALMLIHMKKRDIIQL